MRQNLLENWFLMTSKKYYNFILLSICLLPFVDNITGASGFEISLYFRMFLLTLVIIPALTVSYDKTLVLLGLVLVLLFPLVVREMIGIAKPYLYYDFVITVKILYTFLLTEGLIKGLKTNGISRKMLVNTAIIMTFMYSLPIVIFNFLGMGFSAYADRGSSAFVRAANDLSLLIGILAPFVYRACKNIRVRILGFGLLILYIVSLLLLTTKSGMIAVFMILFMIFIDLIKSRFKWLILSILLFGSILCALLFMNMSIFSRIFDSYEEIYREYGILAVLFRGRDIAFANIPVLVEKMNYFELFFGKGMGHYARDFGEISFYYYKKIWKSAEVDQIDIFFSYGMIGSFLIYVYYIRRSLSSFLAKKNVVNLKYSLILFWIHSVMAGHAIMSPIVGTGIAIVFALGATDKGQS